MSAPTESVEQLVAEYRTGRRRALAKLMTLAENGADLSQFDEALAARSDQGLCVGVTGAPGAGKSTLLAALINYLRSVGKTVCALACDPASPFSGGALLGDRVRIDYAHDDEGVFLRSFSARGGAGALANSAAALKRLALGFGFDVVIIETVGAGQDEFAVRELCDVLVLVLTPHTGDDIQWEKAGVMETADVIALNKADLPGADAVYAMLTSIVRDLPTPGDAARPSLARVSAAKGEGIAELWERIIEQGRSPSPRREGTTDPLLVALRREVERRYIQLRKSGDPRVAELSSNLTRGITSPVQAAAATLAIIDETAG